MKILIALALACATSFACAGSQTAEYRDPAQVRAFKRANPCPATGRVERSCKGYVVDHIVPLACHGPDRPGNMQWQTVADAKAKDKWERKGCQFNGPVAGKLP
jgi:hypothetical protein